MHPILLHESQDESMRREQKEARRAAPSANKLLPIEISIEGLRQVIKAAKCPDMEKELNDEDVWKRLCSEEDFAEAFSVIAKSACFPTCLELYMEHSTHFCSIAPGALLIIGPNALQNWSPT